jgi:hypothetical protein
MSFVKLKVPKFNVKRQGEIELLAEELEQEKFIEAAMAVRLSLPFGCSCPLLVSLWLLLFFVFFFLINCVYPLSPAWWLRTRTHSAHTTAKITNVQRARILRNRLKRTVKLWHVSLDKGIGE